MIPALHRLSLNPKSSVSTDTFYVVQHGGALDGYTLGFEESSSSNTSPPRKRPGSRNDQNTIPENARLVSMKSEEGAWTFFAGESGHERKVEMHAPDGTRVFYRGEKDHEALAVVVRPNGDEIHYEGPKDNESRRAYKRKKDGVTLIFKGDAPNETLDYIETASGERGYMNDDGSIRFN